jgi:hypothetical protein
MKFAGTLAVISMSHQLMKANFDGTLTAPGKPDLTLRKGKMVISLK